MCNCPSGDIDQRYLFSLLLNRCRMGLPIQFVSMHWIILFTSFSSLSILCDPSSLWKFEPAQGPLIALKDAVAAAIIWTVIAHLSIVPSMPVRQQFLLWFWNLSSLSAPMPCLVRQNWTMTRSTTLKQRGLYSQWTLYVLLGWPLASPSYPLVNCSPSKIV